MQDVSWVAPDLSGGERSGPGFRRWVHNLSRPAQVGFAPFAAETGAIIRKPLTDPFHRPRVFAKVGRTPL
jgi:hypothetical protein